MRNWRISDSVGEWPNANHRLPISEEQFRMMMYYEWNVLFFHILSSNCKLNIYILKYKWPVLFFFWSNFPNLIYLRANFPKIKGPWPQVQEGRKIHVMDNNFILHMMVYVSKNFKLKYWNDTACFLKLGAVRTGTLMYDVYTNDRYHRLCFLTVDAF